MAGQHYFFFCLLIFLGLTYSSHLENNYVINTYDPQYGVYIGEFSNLSDGEISGKVYVINETSFQVLNFTYNGNAQDLYFWLDKTERPTKDGIKIPTFEYGIAELGKFDFKQNDRVVLNLPKRYKITNFKSLSLYSLNSDVNYGSVIMPDGLSPPKPQFLGQEFKGSRYSLSSGPILITDRRTIKIFGFTFDADKAPDGYFFAGKGTNVASNAGTKIPIKGKDTQESITAMNERYRGGQDIVLELPEDYDIFSIDWISVYIFRFSVDLAHVPITNISQKVPPYVPSQKSYGDDSNINVWSVNALLGTPSRTNFTFQLGPPGDMKGYANMAHVKPHKNVWYVNGYLAEIYLKRGETYNFIVEGGNDDKNLDAYNALYLSQDQYGGYAKLSNMEKQDVIIIAGGEKMAGRLCEWSQENENDIPDNYDSFSSYKKTLKLTCNTNGKPVVFSFTPTIETPSTLYFNSYNNFNMGSKINVVDELPTNIEDIHEEPYHHDAWLEQQSVKKSPRKTNSAELLCINNFILLIVGILSTRFFY
uniref:Protein Skeletor n=1 Tax=Parastrongyloides trichosuri TaxID=131310 RepID=A0A0N4Z7T6_PARTI